MDWSTAIFDVINIRSFSSLWYWIGVAVLWSSLSHWVLGVPFDLISRAKRQGGEAEQDLIDVVRVNVNRLLSIVDSSATWLIGITFFFVTSLMVLAIYYGVEFAQALLFMIVPVCGVGVLCVWSARRIRNDAEDLQMLFKMLATHRLWTQVIGMISIFFTALYGMYHNLKILMQEMTVPPF
ncbi:MAG: component of SufBCD complex [Pseudomonadota bacterium]